jgi:hypothetical protein
MTLNLIDELTLLALDDEKGSFIADFYKIGYALAGAIILELSLHEKISVKGRKLKVTNTATCNDQLLDHFLQKMKDSKKEKPLKTWVEEIGGEEDFIKNTMVDKLIDQGILSRKEGKILWIFNNDKYPTLNAKPENELKQRLNNVLLNNKTTDLKDVMLIGLIEMCSLQEEVFGKERAKQYKDRIEDLADSEHLSAHLGGAVRDIQDAFVALSAALALTTFASTTIINNS